MLTELLLGLLLAAVLVTLVFKATGTAGRSFERLQDELQLQEARRHILAQLEKTVCYDAQSVRLQADGKISCRMLEGCKQVTVYSDKQGIYQRTRTNKGTGVNPVSLHNIKKKNYADYYANAQADQSNLNQIGADLVADQVDVIVAVATPTAATMLAAVEDTDIPVVYSAVTDPVSAGFDGEEGITGTSDALNTDAIMNLIVAANPGIDTIGLLYDLSQDASTQAIADAKAFCDSKGIKYIEKNGTTTAEVQMAAEALVAAGVKAVFTPTDNTVMTAELSIYETFTDAGVMHFTGADSFALNGAFVGYGVDYVQLGEATADMVVELLCEGKTTADLPYQTFDNGIVTINTESCEALGLDLDTVKEAFKPYCTEIVVVTTQENF